MLIPIDLSELYGQSEAIFWLTVYKLSACHLVIVTGTDGSNKKCGCNLYTILVRSLGSHPYD